MSGHRCLRAIGVAALLVAQLGAGCGGDSSEPDAGLSGDVRPSKRSDTAGIADPTSGTIVVFGGDDGPIVNQQPTPAYRGDTWVFDPVEGWTEVTGGDAPSARGRHAVALDASGGRMLSFGGRFRAAGATGYTLYNDLWAFDFGAQTWTMIDDGNGTAPSIRYFATAAVDASSGKLFVFGGDTNASATTINASREVWSHDGDGWTQEAAVGSPPSARLFMAYTYDSQRNRLVIFGGQIGDFVSPAMNDLYALDLDTMIWSQLHAGTGTAPSGRFSSMMFYDGIGDRYIMTGGHANLGVTNDVWAYDAANGGWSLLNGGDMFTGGALGCLDNPREIPESYVGQDLDSPERRAGGTFQPLLGRAWLFGGESDCSDHLDDTWSFSLSMNAWSEAIEARTGESCARRNDACSCLCL